jgi:hypothetical protein
MGYIRCDIVFEVIVYLIIAAFVIAVIAGVLKSVKQGNALKQKIKDLGAKDGLNVVHVEGLGMGSAAPCNRILIDAKTHKFEIQLEKLRAAVVKSEQELIEKGKSVVGRAVLGTNCLL